MSKLSEKLAEVARRLGHGVAKDSRNQHSRYDYTSAAAVNRYVGPALSEAGISTSVAFDLLDGAPPEQVWLRAIVTFRLGEETIESQGLGAGKSVKGDEKLLMKAESAAVKYAYIHAFALGMGEDPETNDDEEEPQGPDPKKAAAEIRGELQQAVNEGTAADLAAALDNARAAFRWIGAQDRAEILRLADIAKQQLEAMTGPTA